MIRLLFRSALAFFRRKSYNMVSYQREGVKDYARRAESHHDAELHP